MAKDLSGHQQKIVQRYYDQHENIQATRLSEIVSELWLTEDEKARQALWGRAQSALMRMGVDANQVARVVGQRDAEALARLVGRVDSGQDQGRGKSGTSEASASKQHRGTPPLDGSTIQAAGARSLADGRTIAQMRAEAAATGGYDALDEANLKRALKAFRKKLKTLRLDDESKLGGRYVSGGRTSQISAITPPNAYPAPVWAKLVEKGRLKSMGRGLYELP